MDWDKKPRLYKEYPGNIERVPLDSPDTRGGAGIFSLLAARRSIRNYSEAALDKKTLGQLLWASQGVSLDTGSHQFRTAPSAGALYPIETYVVVNDVRGCTQGVYHYEIPSHSLAFLKEGPWGEALARAALGQRMLLTAPAVFIWSALVERSTWKYDQRAYRYIYLDAGHVAQNLALAAVSCGLGSCQVGAFFDEEANRVVDLDGEKETVIYMSTVGFPK